MKFILCIAWILISTISDTDDSATYIKEGEKDGDTLSEDGTEAPGGVSTGADGRPKEGGEVGEPE